MAAALLVSPPLSSRRASPSSTRSRREAGRPPSRRPAVLLAGLALATLAGTAGAVLVLQQDAATPPVTAVRVGDTVALDGLDLTVTRFERRKDAMSGTGTAQQPLSGPAMPMAAGAGGTSGMGDMPGMAGMLQHGEERIDVSVVVRGSGSGPTSIDPDRFRLTSAGRPVELRQPPASTLSRTPLSPGTAMRGGVVLVVPEGTRPLELAYGDEPGRIVLDAAPGPSADSEPVHGVAHGSEAP